MTSLTRLEVRYETEAEIDPAVQAQVSRVVREFITSYLEIVGAPPLWTALDVVERRQKHG